MVLASFTSFPEDRYTLQSVRTVALCRLYVIPSHLTLLAKEEILSVPKKCVWVQFRNTGLARSGLSKLLRLCNFLCHFVFPRSSNLWEQEQTHSREHEALIYQNVLSALHIFFHFLVLDEALYLLNS